MDFFKKALLEIKHVVWPTKKETITYMNYNLVIMIVMTILLAIVGFLFKEGINQAKYLVNPDSRNAVQNFHTQQEAQQEQNLDDTYKQFNLTRDTENNENTENMTVTHETEATTTEAPTATESENTETPQNSTES